MVIGVGETGMFLCLCCPVLSCFICLLTGRMDAAEVEEEVLDVMRLSGKDQSFGIWEGSVRCKM